MTWDIKPIGRRKKAKRIIEHATFDDFKQVRLAFEEGTIGPDTPVPIENLGPIWPAGVHDWSRYRWALYDSNAGTESIPDEDPTILVPPSESLPASLIAALGLSDQSPPAHPWSHGFMPPSKSRKGWPKALREPTTPLTTELASFHQHHCGAHLFIPPGTSKGLLRMIAPAEMNNTREHMLEWESAHDCFDRESIKEANRYSISLGFEPNARIAPCKPRDLLVFACVDASPDTFFVVTNGPAAGKVFFFDHETGIDFDHPIADTLPGWASALREPNNDYFWPWLEEDE